MEQSSDDRPADGRYQVRALERGLAILTAFDGIAPCLTPMELADKVRLPKPTLFRLLHVLQEAGFVEKAPLEGCYRLGSRALGLGSVYLSSLRVPAQAQPILDQLAKQTSETAVLGVLQMDRVLILAASPSHRDLAVNTAIGTSYDPTCTALGKVLLAGLSEDTRLRIIRRLGLDASSGRAPRAESVVREELDGVATTGLAVEDEEREAGIFGIAAPVRDHTDHVVAAIGVAAPAFRVRGEVNAALGAMVSAAAHDLSRALGAHIRIGTETPRSASSSCVESVGRTVVGPQDSKREGGERVALKQSRAGHGSGAGHRPQRGRCLC